LATSRSKAFLHKYICWVRKEQEKERACLPFEDVLCKKTGEDGTWREAESPPFSSPEDGGVAVSLLLELNQGRKIKEGGRGRKTMNERQGL
jgi:hypothetical protein